MEVERWLNWERDFNVNNAALRFFASRQARGYRCAAKRKWKSRGQNPCHHRINDLAQPPSCAGAAYGVTHLYELKWNPMTSAMGH